MSHLTITYNHLNLPSKFTFGLASDGNNIEILYDATGQKLRKRVFTNSVLTLTQDYISGIELKNNRLESIYNEEGRAFNTTNTTQSYPYTWRYEYKIKDHLDDTRIVFSDLNGNSVIDGTSEILQETHYYAFGMLLEGPWFKDVNSEKYRYLYNGKELNEEFGLNLNHQDWRWYDPAVGRWWVVDPKSEEEDQESLSPYHFSYNNPIRYNDPDGQNPILGAIAGGLLEYGTQVATNYVQGNPSPWTTNINVTAIVGATAEGALTSGASVGKTLAVKGIVAIFNNTVEVKYGNEKGEGGWNTNVKTDPVNIVKNAAVDMAMDKVAGSAGGAANKGTKKAAGAVGINNGSMVKVAKDAIKDSGFKVTRATNQAVKANVPKAGNAVRKSADKAADTYVKAKSATKKDDFKKETDRP